MSQLQPQAWVTTIMMIRLIVTTFLLSYGPYAIHAVNDYCISVSKANKLGSF